MRRFRSRRQIKMTEHTVVLPMKVFIKVGDEEPDMVAEVLVYGNDARELAYGSAEVLEETAGDIRRTADRESGA